MKQPRLTLYTVKIKYIRNLSKIDSHIFSVSPQTGKSSRPFLGIIVICNNRQYCIPLSSPKPKHNDMKNDVDFSKIYAPDGKLIGVLNFNNMIPVRNDVIQEIDFKIHPHDSVATKHYKKMLIKQITFCRKNSDAIIKKANKLYRLIYSPNVSRQLQKRCCDFKNLETILDKF